MEHVPCWSQPLRRGVGGDSLGQDQESRALESVQRTQILAHQMHGFKLSAHLASFQESWEDEREHEWS